MSGSVAQFPWFPDRFLAAADRFGSLLRGLAFAVAVALPAVYLPALFAGGIGPITSTVALALLGVHAFALVVGHRYNQPAP